MALAKAECPRCVTGIAVNTTIFISGCTSSRSPSVNVLGAYFPGWLFCIVTGVALTVVIYLIMKRLQAEHLIWPTAIVYPVLVALLSLAAWLMLFQH
jgi:hypothetical protein